MEQGRLCRSNINWHRPIPTWFLFLFAINERKLCATSSFLPGILMPHSLSPSPWLISPVNIDSFHILLTDITRQASSATHPSVPALGPMPHPSASQLSPPSQRPSSMLHLWNRPKDPPSVYIGHSDNWQYRLLQLYLIN